MWKHFPPRGPARLASSPRGRYTGEGIFAVHTWIVVKKRSASRYSPYDYTAWGEPIRVDGFAADGRWFGALPETFDRPLEKRRAEFENRLAQAVATRMAKRK
jgi:hypothetical protein